MRLFVRLPTIVVLLAGAILSGPVTGAPSSAPAAIPGLDMLAGKWTVESAATDPAHKVTVQEDCNWARGHAALVCDIQTTGSFGTVHGMSVHSYDPSAQVYRYVALMSIGSSEASEGKMIDPQTVQWTGKMTMFGHTTVTRLTIKKISDTQEQVISETQKPDGTFQAVMQARRTRD